MTIAGGGDMNITGTFYAANGLLNVTGGGDSKVGSQYISRFLDDRRQRRSDDRLQSGAGHPAAGLGPRGIMFLVAAASSRRSVVARARCSRL